MNGEINANKHETEQKRLLVQWSGKGSHTNNRHLALIGISPELPQATDLRSETDLLDCLFFNKGVASFTCIQSMSEMRAKSTIGETPHFLFFLELLALSKSKMRTWILWVARSSHVTTKKLTAWNPGFQSWQNPIPSSETIVEHSQESKKYQHFFITSRWISNICNYARSSKFRALQMQN